MFLDPGQRYLGLKPELCFPIRALHMNMAAELLAPTYATPSSAELRFT